MSKRRQMTAADYAAMAVCPSLIVLMLAALMHFVILCLYRGQYSARLTYILFMFIMGATGIARISIEYGRAHASIYAGALGLAVVFVLGTFTNFFLAAFVVGLVWFLADRITFDCTVIDDGQDASGEGLIESGGLFGGKRPQSPADVSLDGTTEQPAQPTAGDDGSTRKQKRKTHKPGKTVFYLALAALPLFGLGQFFLPASESVRRQAAMALGLYLFATLTLMVVTSFLGLRRYLRQRGAEMPSNVAVAWVAGGAVLTAVMLIACFALPMPGHMLAVAELPKIESPDWLSPSRWGWGTEGVKKGGRQDSDAARVTEPSSDNPPGSQAGQHGKPGGASDRSGGENASGGSPGGEKPGDGGSPSDNQGSQDAPESSSSSSNAGSSEGAADEARSSQGSADEARSSEAPASESQRQPTRTDSQGEPAEGEPQRNESASQRDQQPQSGSGERAGNQDRGNPSSPPSLPNFLSGIGPMLKLLVVLGLLAVIVVFFLKNPHIWRQWLDAFAAWFHRAERTAPSSGDVETEPLAQVAYRSFDSFRNPLGDGSDPRRAIVVTFQAFDAWAREHGHPRHDDETPAEFATRVTRKYPSFDDSLPRLVDAYNRIVYGRRKATKRDIDAAASTWKQMTSAPSETPLTPSS